MTKNTGGPAFPTTLDDDGNGFSGMTLRDYFAAEAVGGLLSHPDCGNVGKNDKERTRYVAEEAYCVADAMLKARDAEPEE